MGKSEMLLLALLPSLAAGQERLLHPLDTLDGVGGRAWDAGSAVEVTVAQGEGQVTEGRGAIRLAGVTATKDGNKYFSLTLTLPEPVDLTSARLLLDARSDDPEQTRAFYFRCYNEGETRPAWSFNSWSGLLTAAWRTFSFQTALCPDGLAWEPTVVEDRVARRVNRIELIIGSGADNVPVSAVFDNLRLAPPLVSVSGLEAARPLVRDTVLVRGGEPVATILHPDSDAGRAAGEAIRVAVREVTGAELPMRVGTAADREPSTPAILLGSIESNPALLVLYARYLTPVDSICPGPGGALVHTIPDPFGRGAGVVVVGASDDAGLERAAQTLVGIIQQQGRGHDLALGRVFERAYSEEFLRRYGWADDAPNPNRIEQGLAEGRKRLAEGAHTSIAGLLQTVALRYQLTGLSEEAQLFVKLWDLYADSAVADPRKYGGPWGFDSDFPSCQVLFGWASIEYDPSLTDDDRLRTTRHLGRWLAEAVIPKCAGAVASAHVPHNHQTFPALGALAGGLYFSQAYDALEGRQWLAMADSIFARQAGYFKPYEDCNGYQWLTNGHLFRYAVARPDLTVFENGNAQRIVDYCLGTMDNLGIQVPYGDTGSWQCWNSEMIVLDTFAYLTGDPTATWAAARKRALKRTFEVYSFYRPGEGERPDRFNGVRVWPLEPQYYETFKPAGGRPPLERCFDKISFREALDPAAPYLLLDGLANGGHKHLDGNSLPRLTLFDRIWLADNDYFKAQVKYHNSLLVFRDGESAALPPYAELVSSGQTPRYGYSRTRLSEYAGVDWDRVVLWLRDRRAFLVLDRLAASEENEYQFRLLWHGVGQATLDENGMQLVQNGPALRIDLLRGPELRYHDDPELGANWAGYPHAEPVVRSLAAIATVKLPAGGSYLYASALHGAAEGEVKPWRLDLIDGADGVLCSGPEGRVAVAVGPIRAETPEGVFSTDAELVVVDAQGVTLLGCTRCEVGGFVAHDSARPMDVELPFLEAGQVLEMMPLRGPVRNLRAAGEAPPHPVVWEQRPAPERLVLSGNRGLPGAVDLGVKLTSDPPPAAQNVFNAAAPNTTEALLDGKWGNDTNTSVMYEPDAVVTLTLDLGGACAIDRVRWMQWWSTTSSKNTSYLLKEATVALSDDGFAADSRTIGTVTDTGPHPNFGSPLEYAVDAGGAVGRYVRLTISPQPGSAVYLAQVIVEGKPRDDAAAVAPYHLRRVRAARLTAGASGCLVATDEGALLALGGDGALLWRAEFPDRLNDIAAADLDGDGLDEVVVARQDRRVTVLDHDGSERWTRELEYYRRPPYANVALTGDLDGDGRPEVIIGGENWRFYAYSADGNELWNYESVHPSRSGAVADLDGDGRCEVVCGTHYYWWPVLGGDGTRRWALNGGPICYDVATGSFDRDQTRGVVFGGGDGFVHYTDSTGKVRLQYNTGDEVRRVATGDLDGDGLDEILAGSLNDNLYCFDAAGARRWRRDLGGEPTELLCLGEPVVVCCGTAAGRLFTHDRDGTALAVSDLGAGVTAAAAVDGDLVVATADGRLRRLRVRP